MVSKIEILFLALLLIISKHYHIGIPGHEFPQPRELVVRGAGTLTPSGGQVQFFSASTFLMVGPLPVQFGEWNNMRLVSLS